MKTFIRQLWTKILSAFKKEFNFKRTIISCIIAFSSLIVVFPTGALSSKTSCESCAEYYTEIAKNHTVDVGKKKLSGLVVEPKDAKNSKMRQDTDSAITELWGVFKGENASFAPVINANRDNEVLFSDRDFSTESLSLIYTNVGQSSEPYHMVKNSETGELAVVDYKFQSSPLALMFSSGLSGMQDELHIYISQSQAERKLTAMGKDITLENLRSLQKTPTEMTINGVSYKCIIDNIYLDNFEHTYHFADYDYYYATDIGTIIGDFVFVILYATKPGVFPNETTLKRQSLYVMSEYSFRNKFYIDYAKEAYSPDNYSFDYSRANLKDAYTPDTKILNKALESSNIEVLCVLLTILIVLAFAFNIYIIYKFNLFKQPLSVLLITVSSVLPYLVFWLIFAFSHNVYIFSSYSLMFTLILLVAFALLMTLLNCFGREIKTEVEDA